MKSLKLKHPPKQQIYKHNSVPEIEVVVINKGEVTYFFNIYLN